MPVRLVGWFTGVADTKEANEVRADRGVRAIGSATRCEDPVVAAVEDTLAYIAHCCDRFGLPPAEAFRDGLRRYRHQLEYSPGARKIAAGEATSFEEVYGCDDERRSN